MTTPRGVVRGMRARAGLASRLMLGQLVVLLAGVVSIVVLVVMIGPAVFHHHLMQTSLPADGPDLDHIERAYWDALALALGVGLVVSLLSAGLVTWSLARRFRRTLSGLTRAVDELARGRYATRVPAPGAGVELDSLAGTLDEMAARLDAVEESRRQLLSDLAHELRTPIATLAAHHEAMADGVVAAEAAVPVLADQTLRLSRLADDVSEVSRAEEGQLPVRLRAVLVGEVLAAAQQEWAERFDAAGVALHRGPGPHGDLEMVADPQRTAQVLGNLLGNALRHAASGGTVVLSAALSQDEVVITVADDGDGFSPQDGAHLFERFFRAETSRARGRSGSGIGLTISRALMDAQGGTITACSEGLGRGAVFTLRFPRGRSAG